MLAPELLFACGVAMLWALLCAVRRVALPPASDGAEGSDVFPSIPIGRSETAGRPCHGGG
jgi:hypothetical protein